MKSIITDTMLSWLVLFVCPLLFVIITKKMDVSLVYLLGMLIIEFRLFRLNIGPIEKVMLINHLITKEGSN
jgi:hypothetical protein